MYYPLDMGPAGNECRRGEPMFQGLDDFVPTAEDRDRVAEGASKSGQVKINPRPASAAEIRVILEHMRHPTEGREPHLNL